MTIRYMLDTNVASDLIRNPTGPAAVRAKVEAGNICVSIIVAAELRFGCARRKSLRLSRQMEELLSELPVLAFSAPADRHYGDLRAQLETTGRPIGANDLLIAAHALALDAVVVTGNVGEFSRIPGLKVENWLSSRPPPTESA